MTEIPGYSFTRPLGSGGVGEVFLAMQQSLGREVALKLLTATMSKDPIARERFVREARIAAHLSHPHIVPIYDVGDLNGTAYIAMEYEPGGAVAALAQQAMEPVAALRIVRDIADALDYAHREGVIHRDVKPENILRRADGSCLLSDFGIARTVQSDTALTQEGVVVGTPQYMSPEQLRGQEIDGRSDLYSLGVVLFKLLTGQVPYTASDTWGLGMLHISAPIPRLPANLAHLQPLLDCLMAKDPGARPQSGAELVRRIDESLTGPAPMVTVPLPAETSRGSAEKPAIAILPFANLGGDPEQGYFSDGITEDMITELSRWRLLAVRSRSASFQFRGVAVDLKRVARELNVRYVVEGSVRRAGERIRITVQLIDSESGSHIWAEKFDRDASDLFAVQDEVVRTIVSTLVGRFQVSGAEQARRKPPSKLAAYECVLRGNALSWDDPAGAAEAARLFQKAIDVDPDYGFAHAMLAVLLQQRWSDDPSVPDAILNEAYVLAKRAVELDENESTCFSMLAQICLRRRSFDLAIQHGRRAIDLNPTNQWNLADLGIILLHVGRGEEALVWLKRARVIDPYFDLPWYWRAYGHAHMVLGQYREALAMFDHLSERTYRVAMLMAGCHARLGESERAAEYAAECLTLRPDFSTAAYLVRVPYKDPAVAAHMADSLRLAGLPE